MDINPRKLCEYFHSLNKEIDFSLEKGVLMNFDCLNVVDER